MTGARKTVPILGTAEPHNEAARKLRRGEHAIPPREPFEAYPARGSPFIDNGQARGVPDAGAARQQIGGQSQAGPIAQA